MSGPLPPEDLAQRQPLLHIVPPGSILYRFYTRVQDPIYFDRSLDGRLNAPDGSYGVLYAAETAAGAFAETFLRVPGRTLLDPALVARKACVHLVASAELRFIRLAGPGLAILGATAEVVHGGLPYDVPQAWSAALAAHPVAADGIAYYARHDDEELCFAVFERAQAKVYEESRLTLDADWFWLLAERYRVGIAPSA